MGSEMCIRDRYYVANIAEFSIYYCEKRCKEELLRAVFVDGRVWRTRFMFEMIDVGEW